MLSDDTEGWEEGREGPKEGEDIHAVVGQKSAQNCKTILHQLKN